MWQVCPMHAHCSADGQISVIHEPRSPSCLPSLALPPTSHENPIGSRLSRGATGPSRPDPPPRSRPPPSLSGLPSANAKSQRFSYAISKLASLPPVVALNRNFKSQIATRYAAFWRAAPQFAFASFLSCL